MERSKLGKAILAFVLSFAVLWGGVLSTTSPAYAYNNSQIQVEKSHNGKVVKVMTDNLEVEAVKKDDFNAKISLRYAEGKTESISISVIPLKSGEFKSISVDETSGKKFEIVGKINPLCDEVFSNASISEETPYVLILYLLSGTTPTFAELVASWGASITMQVINNWPIIKAAFASGGIVAVISVLASWQVVGAALAAGLAF